MATTTQADENTPACVRALCEGMEERGLKLKQLFRKMDRSGEGSLSYEDFQVGLRKWGRRSSASNLAEGECRRTFGRYAVRAAGSAAAEQQGKGTGAPKGRVNFSRFVQLLQNVAPPAAAATTAGSGGAGATGGIRGGSGNGVEDGDALGHEGAAAPPSPGAAARAEARKRSKQVPPPFRIKKELNRTPDRLGGKDGVRKKKRQRTGEGGDGAGSVEVEVEVELRGIKLQFPRPSSSSSSSKSKSTSAGGRSTGSGASRPSAAALVGALAGFGGRGPRPESPADWNRIAQMGSQFAAVGSGGSSVNEGFQASALLPSSSQPFPATSPSFVRHRSAPASQVGDAAAASPENLPQLIRSMQVSAERAGRDIAEP